MNSYIFLKSPNYLRPKNPQDLHSDSKLGTKLSMAFTQVIDKRIYSRTSLLWKSIEINSTRLVQGTNMVAILSAEVLISLQEKHVFSVGLIRVMLSQSLVKNDYYQSHRIVVVIIII